MEIDLRIPDDYCQGEAETLEPLYDDEIYEDKLVRKTLKMRLKKRSG